MKLLPLTDAPTERERLQREVALLLLAARNAKHVAKVLGLTIIDDKLAIVMKQYPRSLAKLMHDAGMTCSRAETIKGCMRASIV